MSSFHVMAKPAGALCNMACDYCFFTHKVKTLGSNAVMPQAVLETFIRDYIASQPDQVITFTWQGGEPTLAGLDFFRNAIELQQKYCPTGKHIENDLQTNGTLITPEWCAFLKEQRFLVGLSVDGPPELHNLHRRPALSAQVKACAELLRDFDIPFNSLTAVNRDNSREPLAVYRYLRDEIGSRHIQFLPVVETVFFERDAPGFWDYDRLDEADGLDSFITEWSVRPLDYGHFLATVFKEWYYHDYGKVFVYLFESLLGAWSGYQASLCVMAPACGNALALDRDGSLYSCDRFCYGEYRLGNILETNIAELNSNRKQQLFRRFKKGLPPQCKSCRHLSVCHGGCPKNRFALTADGDPGCNYLCRGWQYFLDEITPVMDQMAKELKKKLSEKKENL